MGPICPILAGPVFESGAGHALAESAVGHKIFLQAAQLLVEQIVGLVDQTDRDVGHDLGWAGLDEFTVEFIGLRGASAKFPYVEGLLSSAW